MKTASHFILLILAILSISACRKQITYEGEKKLDKLVIPASFNWETTKLIAINISSDVSKVVTISSEDGTISYHKGF